MKDNKRHKSLETVTHTYCFKQRKKQHAVTLIALVVTIVILIILAAVSINMIIGDNGIITMATDSSVKTQLAEIENQANMSYSSKEISQHTGERTEEITVSEIASELIEKGYTIVSVGTDGITGISLDNSNLSIPTDGTAKIKVTYEGNTEGILYYAEVNGNYYQMKKENGRIVVDKTPTQLTGGNVGTGNTLSATVTSGNNVTVQGISGNVITLKGGNSAGSSVITVTYGSYSKTCNVAVVVTPTSSTTPTETEPSFSTAYGLVDVIWLSGTSNTVTTTPNEPNLYTSNKLTPVTWTYNATAKTWSEDSTAKSTWYSYTEGSGTEDNTSSMWANAKNTDESYFVWIPRYAYRITYYSDEEYTNVTGYYDGWGLWNAADGALNYKVDDGIETVEYNGNKYIVHPAFMDNKENNFDNGGWDKDLTGIWVAKYEMSRNGATADSAGSGYNTTFKSVPGVRSARSIAIGNMYTVSMSYDRAKESHLMKNSEWGAVAFLTQSKYGRNGHEIDINNNSNCITGNGDGAVSGSVSTSTTVTNPYNTATGAKASTTGNIYGIYDMSGGALERVAAYDSLSTSSNITDYGSTFASKNGTSTKYATAYHGKNNYSGIAVTHKVSKTGDATKEVKVSSTEGWFSDNSYVVYSGSPFVIRGGYYGNSGAGVFYAMYSIRLWSSRIFFPCDSCSIAL